MNKLTKQQAEWLIENIRSTFQLKQLDAGINLTRLKHIEEVINQCTEKEFPKFNGSADEDDIDIVHSKYDSTPIRIDVTSKSNPDSASGCIYFLKEEFKKFTEGCLAIVKFLEDE